MHIGHGAVGPTVGPGATRCAQASPLPESSLQHLRGTTLGNATTVSPGCEERIFALPAVIAGSPFGSNSFQATTLKRTPAICRNSVNRSAIAMQTAVDGVPSLAAASRAAVATHG
jgi:hypothetical protein